MYPEVSRWQRRRERRARLYQVIAWLVLIALSGLAWWLVFTIAAAVLHV